MNCTMERARSVCLKAASLCSPRIRIHQPLHTRADAESGQAVSLKGCLHRRQFHHSADHHRFYTNRLYKKCCTRCGRPNIIPMTRCGYCDGPLTDGDIHPVGRDELKELAASRTCLYTRGNSSLQRAELRLSMARGLNVGSRRNGKSCRRPSFPCSYQASTPAKVNFDYSHCIEEYYRSFDFVVINYPFPIATVHLSAVMKGTAYDVKQLRPSHVPLLQRMQRQTVAVVEDILQASFDLKEIGLSEGRGFTRTEANDELVHRGNITRADGRRLAAKDPHGATSGIDFTSSTTGSGSSDQDHLSVRKGIEDSQGVPTRMTSSSSPWKQRTVLKKAVERMKSCIILGFTYPCEYNQVNMHAVVPPIFNFNILRAPFFLPLKKVLQDLKESGSVQVNVREARNAALGRDAILEEARVVDASIRQLLESQASILRSR